MNGRTSKFLRELARERKMDAKHVRRLWQALSWRAKTKARKDGELYLHIVAKARAAEAAKAS